MADETEFAMGAEANCSDGPGGKVIRVIVDPAADTVTHLVVEPRHRQGAGRLVPLDLVDVTADGIRLRCTVEEFGALAAAEETELVDGLDGGFGLAGLGGPMGAPAPVPVVVQDVVPRGEEGIERGDQGRGRDLAQPDQGAGGEPGPPGGANTTTSARTRSCRAAAPPPSRGRSSRSAPSCAPSHRVARIPTTTSSRSRG